MRGINIDATCHGLARDYIQQMKEKRRAGVTPEQALAQRIGTDEDIEKARADLERAQGVGS